ncbi:MAG: hypothetical protein GY804_00350 [Alphaproteobacteria bacterium]|nr:hypothetical protein [Alphaproteobacteria bacterium]
MNTYKNKNFKRNLDCANIVFCTADIKPNDNWIICGYNEIKENNCTQIYMQNGVRYYGYL